MIRRSIVALLLAALPAFAQEPKPPELTAEEQKLTAEVKRLLTVTKVMRHFVSGCYFKAMRSPGTAIELYRRRLLAVRRWQEGQPTDDIADFLEVDRSSVKRWIAAFRKGGKEALASKPVPGRPTKLTRTQEKIALRWLADSPTVHGFDTELWTAARLAELMREEWDITLNVRYLCRWLTARGYSPQRPQAVPRERDAKAIAAWLDAEWTRLKKKRHGKPPPLFLSTKVGY